jgi:hypothetical protein
VHITAQISPSSQRAPLKTANSRRVVPLPQVTRGARRAHPPVPARPRRLIFTPGPPAPLRRNATRNVSGSPWRRTWNPSRRARLYREAAKAAGLPEGTASHDLRHHYASVLLDAGESVHAVAERLGNTAQEVLGTYRHMMPNRKTPPAVPWTRPNRQRPAAPRWGKTDYDGKKTPRAVYPGAFPCEVCPCVPGFRVPQISERIPDNPWITRLLGQSPDPAAERAALEARQPIARMVSADEVAAAIAYLASPSAGATTGTSLAVDGGMTGLRLRPPDRPYASQRSVCSGHPAVTQALWSPALSDLWRLPVVDLRLPQADADAWSEDSPVGRMISGERRAQAVLQLTTAEEHTSWLAAPNRPSAPICATPMSSE